MRVRTMCNKHFAAQFIDAVGNKCCLAAACSCVHPNNALIEPRQAPCSVTFAERPHRQNERFYGPFAKQKDIIADDAKDC
jgi:hypothetical protein